MTYALGKTNRAPSNRAQETMTHSADTAHYWQDFPNTYRAEQVEQIAQWIAAGESGVVLGSSGAGKSNLLGFITARSDILAGAAGVDPASLSVVYFDINSLPLLTVAYFYRGLLQSILATADDLPPDVADALQALANQPGDWNDAFFALTTLGRALELVVNQAGRRTVLLLDRFDEACRRLDAQALNSLRSLRDRFKGRLIYVVATRHGLERLRPTADFDEFYELVAGNRCRVGPMVQRDARWVADQMAERLNVSFSPQDVDRLIDVCGGLPTFLKAGCIALANGDLQSGQSMAKWTGTLLSRPEFQRNCRELWEDLDEAEQSLCIQAAGHGAPPASKLEHTLTEAGLLVRNNGKLALFSPIFAEYILGHTPQATVNVEPAGLILDSKTGVVVRNGSVLDIELTDHEDRLLGYLLSRADEICTKDEIMAAVWPDEALVEGVRDDRLAQLIKRLRDKIEPDPPKPIYVQTIRGRGYRLSQPEG